MIVLFKSICCDKKKCAAKVVLETAPAQYPDKWIETGNEADEWLFLENKHTGYTFNLCPKHATEFENSYFGDKN